MKRMKLWDGSLEMSIQSELQARALLFKRHVDTLPGSSDIVFR